MHLATTNVDIDIDMTVKDKLTKKQLTYKEMITQYFLASKQFFVTLHHM